MCTDKQSVAAYFDCLAADWDEVNTYSDTTVSQILDLAEKMIRLAGYEPYKDIDIVEIGLRPGEKMFEELRLDGETTERTKNNLIFVHPVMKITKAGMDEKLQYLNEVMKDHVSGPFLKNMLLEMIQQNKTDT